jgi:hypothetical protein
MKYQTTTPMKWKTSQGVLEIMPGQVVTMPEDKAARLVELGKVIPLRPGHRTLENYADAFRVALDSVACRDALGEALRLVMQDRPTWEAIEAQEMQVNELWKLAQDGREVWGEYVGAVTRWKQMFIKAIEGIR